MNCAAPTDEVLVELFVTEDPLCQPEVYFLKVQTTNGAYEYFEVSTGASEKRTILSSPERLDARRLVDLLNHHQWFHSNIVLEGLEDSQLAAPEEWIYGGKYPLLSLHSGLDEVVDGFRDWVQSQCARILNQRR